MHILVIPLAALLLSLAAGWISNIVQVCHMVSDNHITAYFIVKCVGIIVAPVGSILGIVGWF